MKSKSPKKGKVVSRSCVAAVFAFSALATAQAQSVSNQATKAAAQTVREASLATALDFLGTDNFVAVSDRYRPYLIVSSGTELVRVSLGAEAFRFFGQNVNGYIAYSLLQNGAPSESLLVSDKEGFGDHRAIIKLEGAVRAAWRPGSSNTLALILRSGVDLFVAVTEVESGSWRQLITRNVSGALLRWSSDGRRLFYTETLGESHELQSLLLHRYDPETETDRVVSLGSALLDLNAAETSAIESFFEDPDRVRTETEPVQLSFENDSSVFVRRDNTQRPDTLLRRQGQVISLEGFRPLRIFRHWVIVERRDATGVEIKAVDRSNMVAITVLAASTPFKLPWQAPLHRSVTQDGKGYGSANSCASTHTEARKQAYAYDFGISDSDRVLSTAPGSVVATERTVTCNTLDDGSDGTFCNEFQQNCANSNGGWGNAVTSVRLEVE